MKTFPLTLLLGFGAGFFGAIPPGPLNVTIIRKTSHGHLREAFRVALGGAIVDAAICGLVGLGFGWILETFVTNPWVKTALALFLVVYGLKVLLDGEGTAASPAPLAGNGDTPSRRRRFPFVVGLVQGAANPALIVNWTILIGFLVGHGLLRAGVSSAAGFALGVGLGVFAWFAVLIELLERLKDHPVGTWMRRSTILAGVLLILFGCLFTWKSIWGG